MRNAAAGILLSLLLSIYVFILFVSGAIKMHMSCTMMIMMMTMMSVLVETAHFGDSIDVGSHL